MHDQTTQDAVAKKWYKNEFLFFIVGSLVVAASLVAVSLTIYVSSGANLLDLSRPGYSHGTSQAQAEKFQGFSEDGGVSQQVLNEFSDLYQRQIKPVTGDHAFSVDALSDAALGIQDPESE